MSKVWRKLNRVGKKASKYKFTTHSHILTINCTNKWHPDRIRITWQRTNRKVASKFAQWEPSLKNPFEGHVYWEKSKDFLEFDVSLYRGINDDKFEQKEWELILENEEHNGRRKVLATGKFSMNDYASIDPLFQTDIRSFKLKNMSNKIVSASISFTLICQFLKEGKATDDDMISIASFMSSASVANNPFMSSSSLIQNNQNSGQKDFQGPEWDLDEDSRENNQSSPVADEIDNDIDFYLGDQCSHSTDGFNNISNNFGRQESNQIQEIKIDFQNDFLKSFDTLILQGREHETAFSKSTVKQPDLSRIKLIESDNPFGEENPNPFEKPKKKETISLNDSNRSNPFLSPTLTSSLVSQKEPSNPFLDKSESNEPESTTTTATTVTAEKRRSPVKIIRKAAPITVITPNRTVETIKEIPTNNLNLSTTSQDLLDWCKSIIRGYQATAYMPATKPFEHLKVDDFTSSWRSGLAFSAIFYHYRPKLIDLSTLNEKEPKKNFSQVFKASDKEKIARCIDYTDFSNKDKLDQLLIMTFLFQLRDHFTESKSKNSSFNSSLSAMFSPLKSKKKTKSPTKTNTSTPVKGTTNTSESLNYKNPFESDPDETEEDLSNSTNPQSKSGISIRQNLSYDSNNNKSLKSEDLIQKANDQCKKNENLSKSDEISEKVKNAIKQRRKSSMAKAASFENSSGQLSTSSSIIGTEYVNQEIINFKNEQRELDEQAVYLEKKLRSVMDSKDKTPSAEKIKGLEDKLLKEWFLLINRKNALLIKQQELEIIQNEKNLERRHQLLSDKLRDLMLIDEFYKTEDMKTTESILLNELLDNVVERNNLVLQMDEENKLLTEGEIIDEYIQNRTTFQHVDKSCSIQ